ncbi:MAG TPA: excinuclease ABC subunit UvrA [Bacteroidaceae bacterium]|nr:excinuclease ABC subunit UvrA [Bacteroidaceae bacterium]
MNNHNYIHIHNARVNNLKGVTLDIPRDKFIVITGLSGSGKSSLAFDTIYAEGQRRYVESLSAYARQFLGRMKKPECDYISGLPPTIAIEQRSGNRNPRSTVGTITEIYDYLRLLFARIGKTVSPISGNVVKKHNTEDLLKYIVSQPEGIQFSLLSPLIFKENRTFTDQLRTYLKEGFTRLDYSGEYIKIEDLLADNTKLKEMEREKETLFLLIDRLNVDKSKETANRLLDSAYTAFYEGNGLCYIRLYDTPQTTLTPFSKRFEADGINFEEPTDQLFAFNSPLGACPTCEGFGKTIGIDPSLVVPDSSLSIYEGAVVCWRGEKTNNWKVNFLHQAEKYNFPIFTPYHKLTKDQIDYLWHGSSTFTKENDNEEYCIDNFFKMLEKGQYKIQNRVMLSRYRGKTDCRSCGGKRLRREAGYVKIGGKSICDLIDMPISDLKLFFDTLLLDDSDIATSKRLLAEIKSRILFLIDVGLEYLTLNRSSNTLSGGESQRINLVTSLGSSLVGSLYILDEPSVGLHSKDTMKLINALTRLKKIGNTVIVVEHDEEIIRAADKIIDVGPKAGRHGGEIVYQGDLIGMQNGSKSYTVKYLLKEKLIEIPKSRRKWNRSITVKGARQNNLKGIDVTFPLNVLTVVSGVSGSGKSTLVRNILYLGLKREINETSERPGEYHSIKGDINLIKSLEFVDQNSIGKTSRSNPVTYVKAYDEIRKLFAEQPLSKQMGFKAGYFSFNTDGGRCEECKGEGTTTISMQFMSDLKLECESCQGKRFKNDILEVFYKGKNIWNILEMTVNQAIEFFSNDGHYEKKIIKKLYPLQQVGLGYIKLGQSSSTLSGGESQRVKLAYYLSLEKTVPTMFIFDEPTTGLHFHDIKKLLESFDALIDRGHTIIIIEHNMEVIKSADYIIDLGPGGGKDGGEVVTTGTPENVAKCLQSYTAKFLREKLI